MRIRPRICGHYIRGLRPLEAGDAISEPAHDRRQCHQSENEISTGNCLCHGLPTRLPEVVGQFAKRRSQLRGRRMSRPAPSGLRSSVADSPAPEDFLSRLAALVPSPRVNLTHFHGVFAPHHWLRARIVPGPDDGAQSAPGRGASRASRMGWAQRLKRVFAIDVEKCDRCGGCVCGS
jgi:hypothetical protein